jgi:signal transduction histidine kinase
VTDAVSPHAGHNGCVAGRIGWLLASFRRAEPPEPAPSGWALTFDAVVAVAAAAGAVYEMFGWSGARTVVVPGGSSAMLFILPPRHAPAAAFIAAALTALPFALRRFCPIAVWLVSAAAIVATAVLAYVPPVSVGAAVYAAYSAITYSRYRNLAIAAVSVVTIGVAATHGQQLPRFPVRLTAIFAIVPAAAAGLGIRVLRRRLADSTARLRLAAADAEAATRRALAAERARIASELHDVVTHNVSVMIVQAGAARKIMASSPADAEGALLAVEATGREAMTELRNLLGLLSPAADGAVAGVAGVAGGAVAGGAAPGGAAALAGRRPGRGPAALRPQPGLGELEALIGRVSGAGLPVELRVSGEPRLLSPGADLAAYRVVQEGLTNVLRHAGRAAATVGVAWGEELVITVSDDGGDGGPGDGNDAADGDIGGGNGAPGRGLLGLRERLALYGGELAAGPRPGGGWQVRAVMPAGAAP